MQPVPQAPATLVAPAAWRTIDFISDLHLAEDTPHAFDAWRAYLSETPADAVLILGDLFEAWVGDDARLEGFEARGAAVLAQAASHRALGFMAGNRDFLLGSRMLEACGMFELADPTVLSAFGERVLLTHGDAMCIDDAEYQSFRRVVRSPTWQRDFLARPLDERRAMARALRAESEKRKVPGAPWYDVDRDAALEAMRSAATPTMIHGHTHRPASEALDAGHRRHVLSDWDIDSDAAPRAEVLRWQADGFVRLGLSDAVSPAR